MWVRELRSFSGSEEGALAVYRGCYANNNFIAYKKKELSRSHHRFHPPLALSQQPSFLPPPPPFSNPTPILPNSPRSSSLTRAFHLSPPLWIQTLLPNPSSGVYIV